MSLFRKQKRLRRFIVMANYGRRSIDLVAFDYNDAVKRALGEREIYHIESISEYDEPTRAPPSVLGTQIH